MAAKANHHYVPQFYLRGFANGVGRQARVFGFDSSTKRSFVTQVRNVGSKRHFNRIDVEGVDPNTIEDGMAEIEAQFAEHLSQVIEARAFPSDDHFNSIMNLLAHLSVRNPRLRNRIGNFHKQIAERIMGIALSSEDVWRSQMKQMREAGYPVRKDVTYKDMQRFYESKEYDIVIDQTHLIGMEFQMVEPVLDCSLRRNWCFASAPEGSHYITSDDPVTLSWVKPEGAGPYPPGHGVRETMVSFPLSSDLLLMGTFEDLPQAMDHSAFQVIEANTHAARYSTNQIYAKDGSFIVKFPNGEHVRGDDLASRLRGRKLDR